MLSDFLSEYKSRGFDLGADTGGKYKKECKGQKVQKISNSMYKLTDVCGGSEITVVSPQMFAQIVKRIEEKVCYKLFE
jgi:hypothetical protein